MQRSIDINCDMGESYGIYKLGDDEALLDLISSANIACGFHAGDPAVMKRTVRMCLKRGIAVGAHPGLPDLGGFGRRPMHISPEEAYDMTVYQVGALLGFVRSEGGTLHHVKPHGALYNKAAKDWGLAEAIADAVYRIDERLVLFGLAGSELVAAARKRGLRAAEEAFADRTYRPEGTLTPRGEPGAVLTDPEQAAEQALSIARSGKVITPCGRELAVKADTLCLHGDGAHAVSCARRIRQRLGEAGIAVQAPFS